MMYVGGKHHCAAGIAAMVARHRRATDTRYVEPFLGGGNTFARIAPSFPESLGADVVPDLIDMWRAAINGWTPPAAVTEAEYAALKSAPPSPLRGFVGFGCSFGGKWFGGYARNRRGDDYAGASRRAVIRQAAAMAAARSHVLLADYRELEIRPTDVVYCDPPYAGVTGYGAAGTFDSQEFWRIARGWAGSGALVLVSEYAAPTGWAEAWRKPRPILLRGGASQKAGERIERLFIPEGAAA